MSELSRGVASEKRRWIGDVFPTGLLGRKKDIGVVMQIRRRGVMRA